MGKFEMDLAKTLPTAVTHFLDKILEGIRFINSGPIEVPDQEICTIVAFQEAAERDES